MSIVQPHNNAKSPTLALLRYRENYFGSQINFKTGARAQELGASCTHTKDLHSCARLLLSARVSTLFGSFWSKVIKNRFWQNQNNPKTSVHTPKTLRLEHR